RTRDVIARGLGEAASERTAPEGRRLRDRSSAVDRSSPTRTATMMRIRLGPSLALVLLLPAAAAVAQTPVPTASVRETAYDQLRWRMVGPARGGRVTTVTGVVQEPHTFYFGSTGGGVWKTTDAGANWTNLSDGQIT